MPHETVVALQSWLQTHEANLLADFQTLLRIPSVETEPVPNGPFGQANRDALDFVLKLGEQWGMRTKDVEGYAGYAEFGDGEKLITVLAHLDVVPVGPGWKYDPFSATVDGGYVYARGAVDDKGPTIAAFYAAKALMEALPNPGCRVRVMFGCDEESGFECIRRYAETEEVPTYGIAPDAGWPLYHAEKGIANAVVFARRPVGGLTLLTLEGGQRHNIVIDAATATARVAESCREEVKAKIAKAWDANLKVSWEGAILQLEAVGKAAHASTPYLGDNAVARILRFFMEIAPADQLREFEALFESTHPSGVGLGIHGRDEMSDLTSSLGIASTVGDHLRLHFNIRYPVTWQGSDVRARCEGFLSDLPGDWRLDGLQDSEPLFFPLDHPLVKTVVDVYAEETGERRKPGVMGGGTYARAMPNSVAIGTGWEGDGQPHQTDERLKISHLHKMARIYGHILYRLTQV